MLKLQYVIAFTRQQEALKAQKEGKVIESVKDEEDDDEGRLIQPLNFAAIQRSLVYEFRSRNGILYVNAIYKKNFIIDKFHFSVSRLFQEKKLRGMQFTIPGSITEFNLGPFCILIEDILIHSMLL